MPALQRMSVSVIGLALAASLWALSCTETPSRGSGPWDAGDDQAPAGDQWDSWTAGSADGRMSFHELGSTIDASPILPGKDTGGVAHCTPDSTVHSGDGTSYGATGWGACSFDATPNDLMVGAMNQTEYASAATCGTCVRLKGPKPAEITIRIVDLCPECKPGDIDLSYEAFALVAHPELGEGRVAITWSYVACAVQGPISYSFPQGSNPFWTAVQVRNHRYQIAKFEYLTSAGTFKSIPRRNDNHFIEASGMGPGPYHFRVTDIYGQVLEDPAITPPSGGGVVAGAGQFPVCQ